MSFWLSVIKMIELKLTKGNKITARIKIWMCLWVSESHVFLIKDELRNTILIENATHFSRIYPTLFFFSNNLLIFRTLLIFLLFAERKHLLFQIIQGRWSWMILPPAVAD